MEYLEDLFDGEDGLRTLRGSTAVQRARTRGIVSLMNDLLRIVGIALIHSDSSTLTWSGLTREQQSATAANDFFKRARAIVSKLEDCFADALEKGFGVQMGDVYGSDVIGWSGAVKEWRERTKKEPWFVSKEELEEMEEQGFETVLFGAKED
ncbi:hypothetical protein BDV96DRAFT_654077 [Lophiotrema nucula]|uniref:Uncharacterized protein n=1 Tax=Lophiotrema nucula TaxID=690887 RepID=A0A6A5YJS2_9PLEO|nr:hypothetical protein BDV96DRAFT_654077 [Lophiotrema nucula]